MVVVGEPFNPNRACVDFFLKKAVKDAFFLTLPLTDALVLNFRLCDDAFNEGSFLSNHDLVIPFGLLEQIQL